MFENLKQFLVEELRVSADDVTMEAELSGDLGINSLELADLVYLCEERFNVVIDEDDQVLTLSTCNRQDYEDGREVVHAVRVK